MLVGLESREKKTVKKQHEHGFGRELKTRRAGKESSFGAQMKRLIRKAWLEIILAKVHIGSIVNKKVYIKKHIIKSKFLPDCRQL